jgi:hypothetical protein
VGASIRFADNISPCRPFTDFGQGFYVTPRQSFYDGVYGPVTLWPSRLTIQDCDQISFHNQSNLAGLGVDPTSRLPSDATIADIAPVDVFPA